ncbi:ISWI chromatin-remodeling complex ATPase ISW2 [Zopfia rhizophila CBS 207.26]|uniref:ISWI chromatin-remodeling complex ATPase ISW2 n=1 Tax=Zopfia rhizophila CBS 207.26 TaxID=1314779 RepID=A0A6A6DNU0_9PEZI|nr:ISWI chromatin-remodeling complex ATPase ISW2 [Zopfia rhizophila CBS 207.26]
MDRPRIQLGSPLPITPRKRPRESLTDLLQQFGSQSSATSVTKARKSMASPQPVREPPADTGRDKRKLRQRQPHNYANNDASNTSDVTSLSESSAFRSPEKQNEKSETSEDELAMDTFQVSTRSHKGNTGALKMDRWRRQKLEVEGTRRSRRNKNDILESDTFVPEPEPKVTKRKPPKRLKVDTARARLRGDIAAQTKAKANRFLVANKEYFLPLLPQNNYISKLLKQGRDSSIVEYQELEEQPKGVTATLKRYQLSGLSFLVHLYNNGMSGILGDEMGLGKTLQTLSLFQYLEEQDQKSGTSSEELRPYLVVCPLSVLNSWVSEAQRWVPNLKVLRFHGTVNERNRLKKVACGIEDQYGNETKQSKNRKASRKAGSKVSTLPTEDLGADSYKIIVTTYEVFQAEQAWFKHAFVWRYAVLDEGHKIKNSVTQISTSLKGVSSEYRLILTGTPLQNNLVEMWALLAWLYPEVFTESTETLFKESFDLNRGKVNRKTMDDSRHLLELIMLRRMKDSSGVNLGLPPKEEVLLYVPLTPMQRFWYTRLLTRVGDSILDDLFSDVQNKEKDALRKEKQEDQMWSQIENLKKQAESGNKQGEWEETAAIMRQALEKERADSTTGGAWRRLMNLVMQLRKCCSHPYLLPGAVPEPYYLGEHVIRASGKFLLLEKLLKHTIYEKGKKVLIFSGFTQSLDCCEDLLTLIGNHGKGFKYLRLDGRTARARRNLDIRMFNNPKSDYKVMLLSTRAGGLGINLTGAEDVIFLDEDWNPQITLQAEARAHRIGQTKKVTIYKLCTQGTVEEQMMGRIRKKLYLSAKITESMRNIHGAQSKPSRGRQDATTDDMPQLDTTQLKSLVRRGAQTLSHPQIDVTEMLSWDLDTMLEKCRDKPSDPHANPDANPDVDEEKWLSVMERVECAVFDGKRFQRQFESGSATSAKNILPSEITREDRRKNKNTTVMIGGFAITKESLNCAQWEAVPTMAGKDPRLAETKREKRPEIQHEEHCLICYDGGELIMCKGCPRSYHYDCLEPTYQAKVKGWNGFFCPQHECVDCGKKTSDAGGLMYRCRWCQYGYCEDCLEWGKEELIGDNLPEFEMKGEKPNTGAFYIKCPACKEYVENDEEGREWLMSLEASYKEQYEVYVKEEEAEVEKKKQEEEQQRLRREQEKEQSLGPVPVREERPMSGIYISLDEEEEEAGSPPALTDTSFPTPAPGESGISTPRLVLNLNAPATGVPKKHKAKGKEGQKKRVLTEDEKCILVDPNKKAKLEGHNAKVWEMNNDPLLAGFANAGFVGEEEE